ncbi:MAG: hypothetical protein J6333_11895, partial [Planctomycetes bacterium]|nr:hypothetical protein [Planctomycetota bacterium]
LRPYLRTEGLPAAGLAAGEITGPACALAAGADFALTWTLSGLAGRAAALFGLEVVSPKPGDGEVFIDRVERRGRPEVVCADGPVGAGNCVPGWITNADDVSKWGYDGADWRTVVKNGGTGLLVTGDRSWQDAELSCRFRLNLGEAGAVVNYQGARRYHAVLFDGEKARLVRQCHGVAVLAAAPCPVGLERPFALKVACRDGEIVVTVDGKEILRATDRSLCGGGAGFACGLANFAVRAVEARGRLAEEW